MASFTISKSLQFHLWLIHAPKTFFVIVNVSFAWQDICQPRAHDEAVGLHTLSRQIVFVNVFQSIKKSV